MIEQSKSGRGRWAAAVGAAAFFAAVQAQAGVYAQDGCQVTAPDGWIASKTQITSPDKKMRASVMSAGSAGEIVKIETGLKAVKVSEDGRIILMMNSASYAGLTNKEFDAITKTTPSCMADVAAPAGPQEAQAKAIALTVRRAQ